MTDNGTTANTNSTCVYYIRSYKEGVKVRRL